MNIVLVTDGYLPRLGGIELHVRDLGLQLAAGGHDVAIVTTTGTGRDVVATTPQGGRLVVHRLGHSPAGSPSAHLLAALLAGADVVHVHSSVFSPFAWRAAAFASRHGTPALITVHSMLPHSSGLPMALALRRASSAGLRWSAVSQVVAAELRQVTRQPVTVLHNGIDPAPWRLRRSTPPVGAAATSDIAAHQLSGDKQPFTIVSALRFTARKRPHALLDVLHDLRARVPAATSLRAVLVGDGPMLADVRRRADQEGLLEWVELPGRTDREELARIYADGDVYVAPARWESFGLAALEARCAGLPVIAMAGSGVGEFVRDGVEGYLADDDAHLSRLLLQLITDPDDSRRIRQHNSTTLPALTWPDIMAETLEEYGLAGAAATLAPSVSLSVRS